MAASHLWCYERCDSRLRASAMVCMGDTSSDIAPTGHKHRWCGQHGRRKLRQRHELPTMAVGALGVVPRLAHVIRSRSIGV